MAQYMDGNGISHAIGTAIEMKWEWLGNGLKMQWERKIGNLCKLYEGNNEWNNYIKIPL